MQCRKGQVHPTPKQAQRDSRLSTQITSKEDVMPTDSSRELAIVGTESALCRWAVVLSLVKGLGKKYQESNQLPHTASRLGALPRLGS